MMNRRNALLGTLAAAVLPSSAPLTGTEIKLLTMAGLNDPHTPGDVLPDEVYACFHGLIDRGWMIPHPEAWVADSESKYPYCSYIRSPKADALLQSV
jgi:hypothetical protein